MLIVNNSSKEIKAVLDRNTGQVIPLDINERPTVKAYQEFKRPAFMGKLGGKKDEQSNT